jgi:hypothetical protein
VSVEAITVVLHHSHARGTAKLVLIGIANHDGDGGSWPKVATLARYAAVNTRSVQRAIGDLVESGELAVHSQDGGTRQTPAHLRPNRYEILVACPAECDRTAYHRVSQASPGDAGVAPRGAAGVTPGGDAGVTGGVLQVSPLETSVEPSFEPSSIRSPSGDQWFAPPLDPFGSFWASYPRKVGKAAAAKAFASACKRAPATDIIDGARRMAADPNLPAARYIPHPTTWLNRDGWGDDPYPDAGNVNWDAATQRARARDEAFAW